MWGVRANCCLVVGEKYSDRRRFRESVQWPGDFLKTIKKLFDGADGEDMGEADAEEKIAV